MAFASILTCSPIDKRLLHTDESYKMNRKFISKHSWWTRNCDGENTMHQIWCAIQPVYCHAKKAYKLNTRLRLWSEIKKILEQVLGWTQQRNLQELAVRYQQTFVRDRNWLSVVLNTCFTKPDCSKGRIENHTEENISGWQRLRM